MSKPPFDFRANLSRVGSDYTHPIESETALARLAEGSDGCTEFSEAVAPPPITEYQMFRAVDAPRITDEEMFRAVDRTAETRRLLTDLEDARDAGNLEKARELHAKLSADFASDAEIAKAHADPDADCKCSACRRHRRVVDATRSPERES